MLLLTSLIIFYLNEDLSERISDLERMTHQRSQESERQFAAFLPMHGTVRDLFPDYDDRQSTIINNMKTPK